MDREVQKKEAVERMKMLRLHENALREFSDEGKLNLSESGGVLFWLSDEQEAAVKDYEAKREAVVYHVIHNNTEFGELLDLLYVSKSIEEWERDREDLKEGYAFVYTLNLSDEHSSEHGTIGIKPRIGGLVRTF